MKLFCVLHEFVVGAASTRLHQNCVTCDEQQALSVCLCVPPGPSSLILQARSTKVFLPYALYLVFSCLLAAHIIHFRLYMATLCIRYLWLVHVSVTSLKSESQMQLCAPDISAWLR